MKTKKTIVHSTLISLIMISCHSEISNDRKIHNSNDRLNNSSFNENRYKTTTKICGNNGALCLTLVDSNYKFTFRVNDKLGNKSNAIDSFSAILEYLENGSVYNSCCTDIYFIDEKIKFKILVSKSQVNIRINIPEGNKPDERVFIDSYEINILNIRNSYVDKIPHNFQFKDSFIFAENTI